MFDIPDIAEAIRDLYLIDPRAAVLCGSSAVQTWTGRRAFMRARGINESTYLPDIDIAVSSENLAALKRHAKITFTKHRHTDSIDIPQELDTMYDSYNDPENRYDIWLQWREASRGEVSLNELLRHSVWNEYIGCMVLTRQYLVAQRERSVAFLSAQDQLTLTERTRLAKDQADLTALRA